MKEEIEIKDKKIQLYLLTGFLGSGKTTILLKILEELKHERVGVIQNEFGKLGIDGTILRNDNIKMVEINRGSIFCSCLRLSFVEALAEMTKQDLNYLFVESSGLGDPSNIEEILEAVKVMAGEKYEFKGVICLVDAVNFMEQLKDEETVNRQLKHCELCIITKVDLVEPEKIDELKEKIREINAVCPIRLSSNGNIDIDFVNQDLMKYRWAESEESTNSPETKPKSVSMNFKGQLHQSELAMFLDEVKKDAYRIKGFFNLKESGWNEVNVVGDLVDFDPCDAKEISQLVFISKVGPQIIRTIANAWKKNSKEEMELKN
nr:CobW family GTP-binding protein [Hathewaya proteolytica]